METRQQRDLLRTVQEKEMAQLVSLSTHIKGGILDLIITNCPKEWLTSAKKEIRQKRPESLCLRWKITLMLRI
jgi:hypothetical protein